MATMFSVKKMKRKGRIPVNSVLHLVVHAAEKQRPRQLRIRLGRATTTRGLDPTRMIPSR
jgi:hypothetical protein